MPANNVGTHPEIDCFDRDAQDWKRLDQVPATDEDGSTLGILLGAEGDHLIFGKDSGGIRLSWVRDPFR